MISVLIVEDDLSIADLHREVLELDGCLVCGIARTVAEAMDTAKEQKPDLAIVDLRLANGDLGTEVAANLRRTTKVRIMCSTGNSNDLSLRA